MLLSPTNANIATGAIGVSGTAWAILPLYVQGFVKILAAVGGTALGWLITGWVVRRFGAWTTERVIPQRLFLLVRGLGAAAAGLAVWWGLGTGGSGFGGGGSVEGGREAGPAQQGGAVQTRPEPIAAPLASPDPRATPARIILLGGQRVSGNRFYVLEGDTRSLTLAELEKVLKDRQQAGMHAVELLIYEDSVARNHPAVRDLEHWAEENKLAVSKLPIKREIP